MESIVVLAHSWKQGGICLAGQRDDGRWVRPVTDNAAGGWADSTLRRRLGHLPAIGERLILPALLPAPLGHQRENCLVGAGDWQTAGFASQAELERLADGRPLWNTGERSGSGIADRVGESIAVTAAQSSLRIIRPQALRFVGTQFNGRFKLRAEFSHGGVRHRLCVTDIAAADLWRERLANGHGGEADALLCVSLALPWEGYCYKLVAGVIEIQHYREAA